MSKYYCPYCNPHYQFHTRRKDGALICGLCGDPLIKSKLIKSTQLFALIAAFAFVSPLIIMVLTFINDQRNNHQNNSNLPLAMIFNSKKHNGF
ncbi:MULTISPECIES: Zn ribbon-like protein [Prochlorococcus]|uniref:Zn ribbon-like protein n=1 Tax=Prochlorococcus marinus (strain SARG / CCMP1375 / SS120) TaxID=167539 RepID=Q7VCN4_PROMA|nr:MULTISPECIES: Zn ribbon-like protein [Prochlorococcus]AAP99750.1 Zn ribbon-like protein [Prochlorococcus marinus subsp. marinus str. CCMP1375]KGG14459.1 hypothetical protein EV04_0036 [Prochlorococcus marinus str. LG]KGG22551.1 hypothetical protein EV08_0066 [Prochlorococcus marinus str. SS2]KGG24394.1 hypothetical protein EV09_0301 [Prochlorococcus marinus str. SS35]KGG34166.1 hypothetical protein EV10_0012 [Prochlorococcus marinus str. SS51]